MNKQELEVQLRPICRDDAVVLMELNNNKQIADFVVGNPQVVTLEQQLRWMDRIQHETNTVRRMIVCNGVAVGTIIISSIDEANATGNMNIKMLPAYQGRGIGKRALLDACNFAFDELNLFCLTANILSYNTASCMLFQKVGFHKDGVLRSRVIKNGERFDLITLSLLKTERMCEKDACTRNRQ